MCYFSSDFLIFHKILPIYKNHNEKKKKIQPKNELDTKQKILYSKLEKGEIMGSEIQIENLNKQVKNKKYILKNVNLKIKKNTFVALVGPSGAGKTTLLNAMSGYEKNNSGKIYYDNYELHENDLREFIAYVPQREILHKDLTLYKELWYAAKLRFKEKRTEEMIERIKEVINSLGLSGKENTLIKNLSGGEKRRLSIALELLFSPKVLILDEPTSGLDLHIEKKLMKLLKRISESGTTIVISAHTVSNLDLCDEIIFMGKDGQIAGVMDYKSSFEYFHVKKFVDIYEILLNQIEEYSESYLKTIKQKSKPKIEKKSPHPKSQKFKEIYYLSRRYLEIIWNDKFLLFMILFQGVIIASLFNIAVPSDGLKQYDSAKIVLFATTCAAMWIGLFNSVQEIVKEKDILKREYMSNISLNSYVCSKIIVLGSICLLQSILFMSTLAIHFELPKEGLIFQFALVEYIAHFFFINFSACMIGLSVSGFVKKQEFTLIFAIIYMIIQLIFSGILLKIEGIAHTISNFIIGKYAIYIMGSTSNLIEVVKQTKLNGILPEQISIDLFLQEAEDFFEYTSSHIWNTWWILILMSIIFICLTFLVIRRIIKKEK